MIGERQKVLEEMKRICEVAEKRESKKMTTEEADQWTKLNVQTDEMEAEIKREQTMQAKIAASPNMDTSYSAPPAERKFSLGQFAQAIASRTGFSIRDQSGFRGIELRAASGMNEGTPSEGGYLVQQEHSTELFKKTYDAAILAPKCRKLPVGNGFNGITMNAIDETSRVSGSRWGGVVGYWLAEAGEKLASKPKLRQIQMVLQKLAALCYATDELIQDATSLESLIMQAFPEEFSYLIDDAIVRGGGAGQPLGILNSPALVTVAAEAGQLVDTIVFENISKMWARMYGKSRQNAVWLINQECETELDTMALSVGVGGVPVYLPANGVAGAPYATLKGRPVIPIEQASALGNVGDIMFVDLSQYLLIDKGGIDAQQSIHVRFIYDETVYRFVMRINGQPMWNSPLTPASGSVNTLSPFVTLAAR
jgi:HK97 family phage major capsid protein